MNNRRLPPTLRPALLAACIALLPAAALAAPDAANQAQPGLADIPVGPTALTPQERALNGGVLKLDHGAAVLDSDVVLKAYVYAWSGQPVDYSAVLTPNSDDIFPPKPVQATAEEKRQIDALVKAAHAHPDLLIRIKEVALDPYDSKAGGFPIENRLFMKGVSYYFDNSPFHYSYINYAAFTNLRCDDVALRTRIDGEIAAYKQYGMTIEAHVVSGTAKGIDIAPTRVVLEDTLGAPLLTATSSP